MREPPPDEGDMVASLVQSHAGAVDALVGDEVVGDGEEDFQFRTVC